jgi:hypothetical protein
MRIYEVGVDSDLISEQCVDCRLRARGPAASIPWTRLMIANHATAQQKVDTVPRREPRRHTDQVACVALARVLCEAHHNDRIVRMPGGMDTKIEETHTVRLAIVLTMVQLAMLHRLSRRQLLCSASVVSVRLASELR